MVKHCVFLLHGMGRHDAQAWGGELWSKLCELSRGYRFFQDRDLDDLAEPVALHYDEHIVAALQRWQHGAESFAEFAGRNALPHADSLDALRGIGEDDAGFVASHVADVIIYRYFKLEGKRIRDSLTAQIAAAIAQRRRQDAASEFTFVAHSLGTAAGHDALNQLASLEQIEGRPNTFRAGNFSFRSIHMLANVSRLLQSDAAAYTSLVRPGGRDSAGSYCQLMYSHRHLLDPFLFPKTFQPFGWPSEYRGETLEHFRDWNIHGFSHYLDHPRVHVPILTSITRATAIGPREKAERIDNYRMFAEDFQPVNDVRQAMSELGALGAQVQRDKGLLENLEILVRMWRVIANLRDELGGS